MSDAVLDRNVVGRNCGRESELLPDPFRFGSYLIFVLLQPELEFEGAGVSITLSPGEFRDESSTKASVGSGEAGQLKAHLVEKTPISDLCDEYGLQPSQIYYWQTQLFEHGAGVFERKAGRQSNAADTAKDRKMARLEGQCQWRPRLSRLESTSHVPASSLS